MPTSMTPPPPPPPPAPVGVPTLPEIDVDAAALPVPLPEDLEESPAKKPNASQEDGGGKVSAEVAAAAAAGASSRNLHEDDGDKKPAAKKHKKSSSKNDNDSTGSLKRVTKTSFAFKTDLEDDHDRRTHPSGIIHAAKTTSGREEHAFGWVQDATNAAGVKRTVEYLNKYGFRPSAMRFIPFTTKENWTARYPHAAVQVECDEDGKVAGNPVWEAENSGSSAAATKRKVNAAMKRMAKGRKSPPKLLARGHLPNAERDELHREIYKYFSWLHAELSEMETHQAGRRQVYTAGMSVPSLRSLLGKLEGSFKAIDERNARNADGTMALDAPNIPGELPFLEKALEADLQRKVLEKLPQSAMGSDGKSPRKPRARKGEAAPWRSMSFDTLFQKLLAFKGEKGHVSPPVKHEELGRWVQEMRANKKSLVERGLECEPDLPHDVLDAEAEGVNADGDAVAAAGGAGRKRKRRNDPDAPPARTNTYLTRSRIERLDSIDFPWTIMPVRVSWEERFEELKRFKEQNGRFPTNKEGTIGNWLKSQRKLFTKNDAEFMANKSHRFEEIGCSLRPRNYSAVTWEDRFQQLVEFGRVNRHFNVPNPFPNNEYREHDLSSEVADQKRFYRFVAKLHTDYRALQRGVPSNVLTEERIAQLRNVGFEFSMRAEKTVPEVDWSTRMQQLESFQSEMGHMRVDPNYDKYSNLGGWAVEVSERHKAWQEGREYLPPDVIERFNQLNTLGFGFDVFRTRRGERSWDESFNLLLQYRQETGTCRVPHHYKADFRLGSWVAVQRKEYKMLMQGKPSRMTQERIRQLENVGFEWVARRGHDD